MSDVVHPRPQLVRESWEDLSGDWVFAHDDADVGITESWRQGVPQGRTIVVPYPPESELSGIRDTGYHPVLWYQREVDAAPPAPGERLLVHFGAVDYRASVWANGQLVGEHTGGHTPFSCDLSQAAAERRPLTLVVRAEDQPTDVSQPRGKQDWAPEPHGIWYHRTSGIWQPVWLERVPDLRVEELHWTPDVPASVVRAEVRLNRAPERPLTLSIALRKDEEVLAEHTLRVTDRFTAADVAIPALRHDRDRSRLLWRPGSPVLLDAEVRLVDTASDAVVDRVASYLGMRSVGVEDRRFLLNGRSVYLRSVLSQGYWPQSHLAAPDPSALRREVELVKELGFNAVRVHQKVEDPRFLYWCDRLGLMVWGEMPATYTFDSVAVERLTGEWVEVLRRDRSHPCIVTWVPFNESWGVEDIASDPAQRSFTSALYHLTKAIDPSRPVISNDGWEHTQSDIWTAHDYAKRGRRLLSRYGTKDKVERLVAEGEVNNRALVLPGGVDHGQPVMLTEFGGVRFGSGDDGWGYSEVGSAEALVDRVGELVQAVRESTGISGFCYTQLCDTEQEQNGLLTAGREPKAPVAALRKAIAGAPPPSSRGRRARLPRPGRRTGPRSR